MTTEQLSGLEALFQEAFVHCQAGNKVCLRWGEVVLVREGSITEVGDGYVRVDDTSDRSKTRTWAIQTGPGFMIQML